MTHPGIDVPLSIERLARQLRRLDAEYATLKRRLAGAADAPDSESVQRRMADLKNRRVTLAGEIGQWLATAPAAQRARVHELLTPQP